MRCILALLLAVRLAPAPTADDPPAVSRIRELGGRIKREDNNSGKPVVEVDLSLSQVTDSDLTGLKQFKRLMVLNLSHCSKVTNVGLKELKELKQLRSLNLIHCENVKDAGIEE